jgi:hypothetical protein
MLQTGMCLAIRLSPPPPPTELCSRICSTSMTSKEKIRKGYIINEKEGVATDRYVTCVYVKQKRLLNWVENRHTIQNFCKNKHSLSLPKEILAIKCLTLYYKYFTHINSI